MLYLISKSGAVSSWHCGNPGGDAIQVTDVDEVQADDIELHAIYALRSSWIPASGLDMRVMRFFGDDAKFIAANLVKCR